MKWHKIQIYQQLNPKNKLGKQRQNHGYKECFVGGQMGGAYGGMDEEVKRIGSYKIAMGM